MNWLTIAGKIDGGAASVLATLGMFDPQDAKYYLLAAGIVGAVGVGLNAVAAFMGQPPVAPAAAKIEEKKP